MKRTSSTWFKTRKFFNDIHLWMGLASGIIVFIVCLTGTIYVFNTEIREAATPELFEVEKPVNAAPLASAKLIADVEAASGGKVVNVKIPASENRTWQFGVKKSSNNEAGKSNAKGVKSVNAEGGKEKTAKKGNSRPVIYYVNPYNATILGNSADIKSGTVTFMTYMFSLHRWLLLDKIETPIFGELENRKLGSYITGTATILFTLGVITGMVIWIPRKIRSWKDGFKIKWSANWKRINHDLHNSLGLYACVFLFLMGITGPQWSFEWYRTGLRKALGTYQPENSDKNGKGGKSGKEEKSKKAGEEANDETPAIAALSTLTVDDYHQAAAKVFPFAGDVTIGIPDDANDPVKITKFKTGFFAPAAADRVTLDQYSAAVVKIERFADMPVNERISGSIKALHLGDVYGMFSKIIYFLACLVATSLPITGTLIWLNKMKKKPARKVKAPVRDKLVANLTTT